MNWIYIVVFIVAAGAISIAYRKKFEKNFLLGNGSIIDFPIILCFIVFWGSIYLGFQKESDAWKEYRNDLFEEVGLDRDTSIGISIRKSETEEELIEALYNQYYSGYNSYTLNKWESSGCVYPKNNDQCEDKAKKIFNDYQEIIKLFYKKAEIIESQEHYLNPLEYKSNSAKTAQIIFVFLIGILLLIHISASSILWGTLQTLFKLPIMGPLSGILIILVLLGGARFLEKSKEKKELSKAISEGMKDAKKNK
tara:strand:+ start:617 stop:1372 length:756 start_codon:yes stop_codon:yes gene_type:complete